jgi:hypothetical protein
MTPLPRLKHGLCALALALATLSAAAAAGRYQNFSTAIYIPIRVVQQFKDPQVLQRDWDTISRQLKVDKVYIESYRSYQVADEQVLEQVKKFFLDRGVKVAGGMALSAGGGGGQFESFSYTDPKVREYVSGVVAMTARHFDEIILDDFFFVNTKTDSDIAAKGGRTWTQFRLDLMDDVAENLLIKPARAANPACRIVIKFPNWYEHFQGLGYDLDKEPKMFAGIYTGTETREGVVTDQHLQPYESYQIFRYFENIKPGGNGGGWVDTYDVRYIDRYAEQLWDTLFAKAPEIMLFEWSAMLNPVQSGDRYAWQGLPTSFDYGQIRPPFFLQPAGRAPEPTMARVAGYSLEQVDGFLGKLGNPIGIACYKPYQSTGEDFLHNYLGMIGIPIDLHPDFPTAASLVLLTESAKFDPDIVARIKGQLTAGKSVVITSGLLRALKGRGIEDIAELEYTDHKAAVQDYWGAYGAGNGNEFGGPGPHPAVLFPEIRFLTNETWPLIRGVADGTGFPLLLMEKYSKGALYVLTVPENFADLYRLPPEVTSEIKSYVMRDFPVRVEGPAQVALFAYDNHTFIVQSFLPVESDVRVLVSGGTAVLRDLVTGQVITGQPVVHRSFGRRASEDEDPRCAFTVHVMPHSYCVFASEAVAAPSR